jgi:sugar lactone lactonase YvrE
MVWAQSSMEAVNANVSLPTALVSRVRRHLSALAALVVVLLCGGAAATGQGPVLIPNVVSTVAGNAQAPAVSGFGGDGGPATAATLNLPSNVIADANGDLYIADSQNNVIREVNAQTGIITTVAGIAPSAGCLGVACFNAGTTYTDGGLATQTQFALSTTTGATGGYAGMAIDALGNLYIVDSPPSSAASGTLRVVYQGGTGVAAMIKILDPAGVNASGGTVLRGHVYGIINPAGAASGSPPNPNAAQVPSVSRFSAMTGVALDALGNIYVADGHNNIRVINTQSAATTFFGVSVPAGMIEVVVGNVASLGTNYSIGQINDMPVTTGTIEHPRSIYVDAGGDLFYIGNATASFNSATVAYAGGATAKSLISALFPAYTPTLNVQYVLAGPSSTPTSGNLNIPANTFTGFSDPTGLTVDAAGDLYIADSGSSGAYRVDAVSGSITLIAGGKTLTTAGTACGTFTATDTIGDGCTQASVDAYPSGVTLDAAGNLYFADRTNNTVRKASLGTQFAGVVVGSAAAQQVLRMKFYKTNLPAATTPFKILSGTAEFSLISSTCGAALTDKSEDCLLTISFSAAGVGTRIGQLQATDASGVAHVFAITGTGLAPAVAVDSATASMVGNGLLAPSAVAVDSSGNTYVADTGDNRIVEFGAGSTTPNIVLAPGVTIAGYGVNTPTGVAVDALGTVYVADTSNNRVLRLPPGGTPTVLAGNYSAPLAVAVDRFGNVYVADTGNARVVLVESPGMFPAVAPEVLSTGAVTLSKPVALAVDLAGNVWVADAGLNQVVELPFSDLAGIASGTATAAQAFGSGFAQVGGVAVDPAGTVYVSDTSRGTVTELTGLPSAPVQTALPLSGLSSPTGIALDTAGNLYVANTGSNNALELNRTNVSLLFAAVNAGSTSAAQTVLVSDIGTQPLSFSAITVSPSFQAQGTTHACGATTQLALGANCTLTLAYAPTATVNGNGTAVLTDNAFNKTQTIQLLATGTTAQTITFSSLANTIYGQTVNLSATASSGLAVTFTVTSGPATLSGNVLTTTGQGTVTVTASQPGSAAAGYAAATPVVQTFTVAPAVLEVIANDISGVAGQPVPTYTATYAGFVNGDTFATALTGAPSLTTNPSSPTAAGSYTITPAAGTLVAINGNYTFVFVKGTLSLASTAQTVTFTAISSPVTYGVAVLSLTATAPGGAVTFSVVSGPGTVNGSSLTITGAGTVVVKATQAGNGTYAAASATQMLIVQKAALAVTASPQTIVYGAAVPTLTYTIAGFVNGDTSSVVSGSPLLAISAVSPKAVGTYPISVQDGTLSAANYTFSFVGSTLTITRAPLSITIGNGTSVYGSALPVTYTQTVTGLQNGDSLTTDLNIGYVLTPKASQGSPVGTYSVGAALFGAASANYALIVVPGKLTITPLAITATPYATQMPYGTTNLVITGPPPAVLLPDVGLVTAYFTTAATSTSPLGTYPITGVYLAGPASPNYTVSLSGSYFVNVVQAGTLTSLASNTASGSVTLIATVNSVTSGSPTGSVVFYDGGVQIGTTAVPLSGGVAQLVVTNFAANSTHSITAIYSGDVDFLGSTATPIVVSPSTPTILMSLPSSASFTIGTVLVVPFTITSVGAYAGTVTFNCSGLPVLSTCIFTPTSLTFSNNGTVAQSANVSFTSVGPGSYGMMRSGPFGPGKTTWEARLLLLPAGLLALFIGRLRRRSRSRWSSLVLALFAVCAMAMFSGCGSPIYTPTGTYNVIVNAVSVPVAGSGVQATTVSSTISLTFTK